VKYVLPGCRSTFGLLLILICLSSSLQSAVISGFVRDESNGEPLSFANVMLSGTEIGAATGQDGYYVITNVPAGSYTLAVTYIGFRSEEQQIQLSESEALRLDIRLQRAAVSGETVTVTAERERFRREVTSSQISLDQRSIEAAPSFVEADVFRALQMLPGVQALNDFSPALYVRGSTPDQNLIMLDGITVYNPMHLGGIFSTFNTDAIKEADFYAGGFAAEYGGRMGSILNIINREGNTESFSGSGNVSLLSSKLTAEGPLRFGSLSLSDPNSSPADSPVRGSWMLAGRRTYFDVLINTFYRKYVKPNYSADEQQNMPDKIFPYYFYDLQGKINLDLGSDHRLTWSSFYGDDVLAYDYDNSYSSDDDVYYGMDENYRYESRDDLVFDWRWGNFTNSLSWRWLLSPELVLKTYVAQSRFRFNVDMDNDYEYSSTSAVDTVFSATEFNLNIYDRVKDRTVRSSVTWKPVSQHSLDAGFEFKSVNFGLAMIFDVKDQYNDYHESFRDSIMFMESRTAESAFYLQDSWQISALLSLQTGLRSTYFQPRNSWHHDPRFALKYYLTDKLSVKLSQGRYHQFLTVANPPDENLRFLDIWFGIPEDKLIPWADHSIFGIEYLSEGDILFRAETYYKHFSHLLTLKPSELISIDPDGAPTIDPFNEFWDTDAFAYGQEFLIKKISGRLRGWTGYTYSVTKRRYEGQDWYFPKYDRTHTLNLVGDLQISKELHVSSALSYSTGNPYTPIIGRIESFRDDSWTDAGSWTSDAGFLYGDRHSDRFPDYFRLDIAIKNRKETSYGYREWYFQVLNATNHQNVFSYVYRNADEWGFFETQSSRRSGVERAAIPMFPFMPTFGFKFEF